MSVAVTGLGAVSPAGVGARQVFAELCAGHGAPPGDTATAPDPDAHLSVREARRLDRFAQFALVAAREAVADSKLDLDQVDRDRVGVVVGTGVGGIASIERGLETFREKGERQVPATLIPMLIPDAATAAVSIALGLKGPGHCVSSACATGNHALGEAKRMIERGDADVVLAGAAEAAITPLAVAAFRAMGALSSGGISRPFDAGRDGFVMGEGGGVLVLESLEHAAKRGADVYCELSGYGASHDAHHVVVPDPTGHGPEQAIRAALADAGVERVDYVNAHGTSTPLNDKAESAVVERVVGAVPISSSKSGIGHLLGGAGAVEAVVCALSIQAQRIHPTINYETPDPDCRLDYVVEGPRGLELDSVLSNSFGFGGHNACLVFKRASV
ncbi:MAG: beta-ketoacyl-ACP synthase II [Solirubrobacterales bacterium]